MQYEGSVSPPREPPNKKRVIPRRQISAIAMGDTETSRGSGGVKESSLLWPMLTTDNYTGWAMLMQCNYEALEIWG
jgi:hypothetical protein